MHRLMSSSTLLLLHGHGNEVWSTMGDLNFATGQREPLPYHHYLEAVRRLHLTSRQIQHLQLMQRQFDRMTRQQHQAGQRLVRLSNNSLSLQAAVAGSMSGWASDLISNPVMISGNQVGVPSIWKCGVA